MFWITSLVLLASCTAFIISPSRLIRVENKINRSNSFHKCSVLPNEEENNNINNSLESTGNNQHDPNDDLNTYINGEDINSIADQGSSEYFETAVKQLIGDLTPKEPEVTPAQKFNEIYKGIKAAKSNEKTSFDSSKILASLFDNGDQKKDPFDERILMIKLRGLLAKEDLEDIFKDPAVGDWL